MGMDGRNDGRTDGRRVIQYPPSATSLKEFSHNNINWKTIYTNQVWKITERKIGEFNYKLLCNILCTRDKISKWNNNGNDNMSTLRVYAN